MPDPRHSDVTNGCPQCGRSHAGSDLCPTALLHLGLSSALAPGTRLGPYEVVSAIGAGGMGEVYRARDERLKRDVAVKVLPATMSEDPERLERFQKEAQSASALNHPNILAVYDIGSEGGTPYMVSELLEGQTLRQRLSGGALPVREAVECALQVSRGLAAAHGKGIVHRDLKPENVFVTNDGHVKILDFGLAKTVEAQGADSRSPTAGGVTEPGVVMGTPAYMSPEQVRGENLDSRSDVFSFGAVLYEMLAGHPAFQRPSAAETISAILREEPEEGQLPAGMGEVVRRCLEKDPSRRFQSAGEITLHLTSGFTTSLSRGTLSPATKRRVAVTASVLAVMLIAGAIVVARRATPAPSAVKRVAVLPFENLGRPDDEYFADGISDEVRGRLTMVPGIEVIARASSTPYKKTAKTPQQIARELGVGYLLSATVRWNRENGLNRVHVVPELVEVRGTGAPTDKWQQPFDAALSDVFRVQGEIASQVAQSLEAVLSAGVSRRLATTSTRNLEAYDAYLRAEAVSDAGATRDPARIRRALELYDQAVGLDPGFEQAVARVSLMNSLLYFNWKASPELAERARVAAEKAVALAPNRVEGRLALAAYQRLVLKDFRAALDTYDEARRLAPSSAELVRGIGISELFLGHGEAAVESFRRAEKLDPLTMNNPRTLGEGLLRIRRYREAAEAIERARVLAPDKIDVVGDRILVYLGEGDLEGARGYLRDPGPGIDRAALVAYLADEFGLAWVLEEPDRSLLLSLPVSAFDGNRGRWAMSLLQACVLGGDGARAHTLAEEAREDIATRLRETPDDAVLRGSLAIALAHLGRRKEAELEARRATVLLPLRRDAVIGAYLQYQSALVHILNGESDKALEELEQLLAIPFFVSPGWLRIDPNFDSLRSSPRFQKLVHSG